MSNMISELTEKQLRQVEDYLVERLPDLLRRDPKIAITIEGILAQHFPRRDEFARLLDEVQALRQEMNERFAQVDQRFEQVDQSILGLKRDVIQIRHGQEMIIKRLDGQDAWVRLNFGDLRNEKGANLEEFFAAGLRYGLKDPDISAEKIRLRQPLIDTDGAIFPQGFATEVDLYAENGSLMVFEVKATAKGTDIDVFSLKVRLIQHQNPDKRVYGVFISVGAPDALQARAEMQGVELVR